MRYRRVLIPGATYFLTFVTFERRPVFADLGNIARLRAAFDKVQRKRPFTVEAEVILPDHIHTMWTLPDGDADYPSRVRLIKTFFSKSIDGFESHSLDSVRRSPKRERAIWQRRFWEHTIRDDRDFLDHLDYIHFNPVKHGLAKTARDWPHSTFSSWVSRGVYESWWGSEDMPPLPDWAGRE